jgi:GT2 family glycosyltransferase
MPNAAYGSSVQPWAASLKTTASVILSDALGAPTALIDAIERRRHGEQFFFGPALEVPRAAVARKVGETLGKYDPNSRRSITDQIASGELRVNDGPITAVSAVLPAYNVTIRSIATLSDGLIFRSQAQRELFNATCGLVSLPAIIFAGTPEILDVRHKTRENIVVFGPSETPEQLLLLATALSDLHIPVVVIANREHVFDQLDVRFVGPERAGDELARAAIVVEGAIADPIPLLVLSQLTVPFAVATTTGSLQYRPDAVAFEPWSRPAIVAAALRSLGAPDNAIATVINDSLPKIVAAPPTGPLVSIIIPTFNRRDLLPFALDSACNQAYGDVEVIVVDDCGEQPIDDIISSYGSRVRLIRNAINRGLPGARNAGAAQATGTYLIFLDDDDELLPNHCALLASALERSRAAAANSIAITRYLHKTPDGSYRIRGYQTEVERPFDFNELLVTNASPPVTVMIRRDVFEQVGGFDERLRVCLEDHDFWLRVVQDHDIIQVPHVTAIYSRRDDGSNMISYTGSEHRTVLAEIYERYPAIGRDVVLSHRERVLSMLDVNNGPQIPASPQNLDEPYRRITR